MARKTRTPKIVVSPEVKEDLLKILFAGSLTAEVAEKLLTKNWVKELEKYFEKPVETPVELPKNIKYKQAYEKLARQIEKMNELVVKIAEETKE